MSDDVATDKPSPEATASGPPSAPAGAQTAMERMLAKMVDDERMRMLAEMARRGMMAAPPQVHPPFYAPSPPAPLQPTLTFEEKIQKLDAFINELFVGAERDRLMRMMRKLADRLDTNMLRELADRLDTNMQRSPRPPHPGDELLAAYREEKAGE